MYPQNYFALFPPFPRENKVFVAMSFDSRFTKRWEEVIAPGIKGVSVNDVPLEPHRVDTRRISDSVLTEILGGISDDLLVLADVTSIGTLDGKSDGRVVRNDNVMYEVGLAHALRLPEEVVVLRSDSDELLFDLKNVRVNKYDPDGDPTGSKQWVSDTIVESLKEVNQQQSLAVRKVAHSLDATSWVLLQEADMPKGIQHPRSDTMGQALSNGARIASIMRLLDLGAIEANYVAVTPEQLAAGNSRMEDLIRYELTAFGQAVLGYSASKAIGK